LEHFWQSEFPFRNSKVRRQMSFEISFAFSFQTCDL
jgi:hypothetical protein